MIRIARLPKSIIKKYGITKKAWRVYRGQKATKRKPVRRKTRTKTKTRVKYVARRRKKTYRKSRSSLSPKDAVLYGLGYGAVREPINQMVKKFTGNMALNVGDEVVLGALYYFGAKGNWFGMRKLWTTGLAVEAHNLGRSMSVGGLNFFNNNNNTL